MAYRGVEDLAEAGLACGQFTHLGDLGVDVALGPYSAQHRARLILAALGDQPMRALVLEEMPTNIKMAGIAARPNISRQFWLDANP